MDYAIAAQFLAALDPVRDAHRFVALHETDKDRPGVPMFGTLAECWASIVTHNACGYGIFVNVNAVSGTSGTNSDVTAIRAVWRDNDDGDTTALPLAPHIVVQSSPGKTHEYWLADCNSEDHDAILRGIVNKWRGDPCALGLARVLRLPGTLHCKGEPHLVTCVVNHAALIGGPYRVTDFERALGELPRRAAQRLAHDGPRPDVDTIRAALACIPADDRTTWRNVGMALHDAFGGSQEGMALFDAWSQTSVKYGGTAKLWQSLHGKPGGITLGTLFATAREYGYAGATAAVVDPAAGIAPVPNGALLDFASRVFRARSDGEAVYAPHQWIAESYALRKTLSLIVAQPGVGKSTLALQLAACVALGDGTPYDVRVQERAPVLVISAEDAREFVEPRVAGVFEHLRGKSWTDDELNTARENVHIYAEPFLAVARAPNRALAKTALVDALRDYINEHKIGLFILDPLVETHEADENNNAEIRFVSAVFREVATATGAAGLIVHHGKKVSTAEALAGDLSLSRGGSSLGGAVRAAVTLTTMTPKEATELGIGEQERRAYFRADGAKNSHGRVIGARWYKKESVRLSGGLETPVCVPADLTPVKVHEAQRQLVAVADLIPDGLENAIAINALVKIWLNDPRGAHLTTRRATDTALAALADDELVADTHIIYLRRSDAGRGGKIWRERIKLSGVG